MRRHAEALSEQTTHAGKARLRRAVAQFCLGFLQMTGAVTGTVLLVHDGVTRRTICAVAITGIFSLISRLVFHRSRPNKDPPCN